MQWFETLECRHESKLSILKSFKANFFNYSVYYNQKLVSSSITLLQDILQQYQPALKFILLLSSPKLVDILIHTLQSRPELRQYHDFSLVGLLTMHINLHSLSKQIIVQCDVKAGYLDTTLLLATEIIVDICNSEPILIKVQSV